MQKSTLSKKQPKLIQVLQKLSTPQITKLGKLITSPYFHETKGVIRLFTEIRMHHPDYPLNKVSNEELAARLFPNVKNGVKKVKGFKSDLMKLIEKFLILEQLDSNVYQQKFYLTRAYHDLQLPKQSETILKKTNEALNQQSVHGLSYYLQQLQMAHYQHYHPDNTKPLSNQEKLQNTLDRLDLHYVLAKYIYHHEVLERTKKNDEQYEERLWDEVQILAQQIQAKEEYPLLFIYQQLRRLGKNNLIDEPTFHKLKDYFFQQLSLLQEEEQQTIFSYLINYTIRAINAGALHFTDIQFELYKNGLANKLILKKKRMTENSFINIVIIAAICKAFDWISNFMKIYQNHLYNDIRTNVLALSNAFILFHQQAYGEALRLLSTFHPNTRSQKLYELPLSVKILFDIYIKDQSYYNPVRSKLASLSNHIVKKYKLAEERKIAYLNFASFTQQLVELLYRGDTNPQNIQQISKAIAATDKVIHKRWLQEKSKQISTNTKSR